MAVVANPEVPAGFDFRSRPRIATGRLDEAMADHDGQLGQWRKDHLQALQLEAQQAARELGRERAHLKDLAAGLGATERLTEAASKVYAEGVKISETTREAAVAAAKRVEIAEKARNRLLSIAEARNEDLRLEEGASLERLASIAARAKEIERFMSMYRDRLGLSLIRVAPQAVRLTFTLLDRTNLGREFSFTLRLSTPGSSGDGCCVEDCSPALPKKQAQVLLDRLNAAVPSEDAALPAFVCGMRRAFQASLSQV